MHSVSVYSPGTSSKASAGTHAQTEATRTELEAFFEFLQEEGELQGSGRSGQVEFFAAVGGRAASRTVVARGMGHLLILASKGWVQGLQQDASFGPIRFTLNESARLTQPLTPPRAAGEGGGGGV